MPPLGKVRLQNVWGVAPGQSPDAIVVMAHRDDTGIGPGANDNATGTAALIELARSYAQTSAAESRGGARIRPAHTIVFLSTDGDAFGEHRRRSGSPSRLPFHVVAAINLVAHRGQRAATARDQRRRSAVTGRSARRDRGTPDARAVRLEPATREPHRPALDLAFPLTFYGQGPFVAKGVPAVSLTTAGERPPAAFTTPGPRSTEPGSRLSGAPRSSCSARSTRASS